MNLSTGTGKFSFALKTLRAHWELVSSHWTDEVRQDFEENQLKLIEAELIATLNATNNLAQILVKAQQECE